LKPHRAKYWLNHEVEDEAQFREEARTVCKLYHQAAELHEQGIHLIGTDEKTGIQAPERLHPTRPMEPGKPEATEFEYIRHGTQALIANFEVATGQVINPTVGDTRTEEDFVSHIRTTVETDPEAKWVFIVDQLNTHKSAGLVKLVAELCRVEEDLGVKGQSGILKDMDSRAAFLQDVQHRIRLVYTPKHCSWLNQIEIWFGTLARRLLKRGTFSSKEELKQRILAFIKYFNETLARPFRWTYIGKPLMA
jgi:transposase